MIVNSTCLEDKDHEMVSLPSRATGELWSHRRRQSHRGRWESFHGVHCYPNSYPLSQVKLLPPVIPPMLYAAGPNYRGHVEGMARRRGAAPHYPERPEPNFRSVHALIGTEDKIIVPKESSGAVQPEGQLAVVIGKKARNVSKESALDYIFGYSIGNDISQRPWQQADRTMFRGKNCDTFKPFGPWIVTGLDPAQFRIIVRHNGEGVGRFLVSRPDLGHGDLDSGAQPLHHPPPR